MWHRIRPRAEARAEISKKMTLSNEVLTVGAQVPEFELETYNPAQGEFSKISLADIKAQGRWLVLVFYPADFTFVCPTELADLAVKHEWLEGLGAEVVSVSTDTKFAHLAWKSSEKLLADVRFQMAADPTREVSKMFGVYDKKSGLALRGTFVIDPNGVLVSSEVNYFNVGRNADELCRKMEANAYLAKHPNEACPARWQPGRKTLTPSAATVGKVFEALS
jgi:peroxiredoxin (alkyl hydroperoxide reductase subunit C)